jgi:DNA excision repair protein ERCC-4
LNQDDPDIQKVKLDDEESPYAPQDVLLTLPGITTKNFQKVMNNVKNLYELSRLSLEQLVDLIGTSNGKQLYEFFHTIAEDV